MGQVADDMINGFCCSSCSEFFLKPHGYPVLCKVCWNEWTPKERKEYQRAHIVSMDQATEKQRREAGWLDSE